MINRVDNNYSTNPYINSRKNVSKVEGDAPPFLLNYDEKGVIYEKSDKQDKDKNKLESSLTEKKSGEKADNIKITESADKKLKEESSEFFSPLDVIKIAFSSIGNVFKALFRFIWYGNGKDAADISVDDPGIKSVNESVEESDKESVDKSVDEAAIKADLNSIGSASNKKTEFERRLDIAREGVDGIPARNTSLLTTYDKRGNIKEVSPSDSYKILKGDKSLKL